MILPKYRKKNLLSSYQLVSAITHFSNNSIHKPHNLWSVELLLKFSSFLIYNLETIVNPKT